MPLWLNFTRTALFNFSHFYFIANYLLARKYFFLHYLYHAAKGTIKKMKNEDSALTFVTTGEAGLGQICRKTLMHNKTPFQKYFFAQKDIFVQRQISTKGHFCQSKKLIK